MKKESAETILLPTCVWNKEHPVKVETLHYEIANEKDYGNGRRPETYDEFSVALKEAKKKWNKGDEFDDYHNSQAEVITKVTIIREIVRIIQPREKH